MSRPVLIDTHTHLDFHQYDADRDDVVYRAKEADVVSMITIGIDRNTSLQAIQIAQSYDNVFAAAGVHPHDAADMQDEDVEAIRDMLMHPKVVAIGEVGLDFYRDISPRDVQKKVFRQFLDWSLELQMPLIIHTREADDDVLDIIRDKSRSGWRGVFHCFSGDLNMAANVLDLGFHISFTGNITFKKSSALRVAKELPLERLMIETDSPFMAPVPHRGKRNEPAYVQRVAQTLAEVKNIPFEQVAQTTTQNAIELFQLSLEPDW